MGASGGVELLTNGIGFFLEAKSGSSDCYDCRAFLKKVNPFLHERKFDYPGATLSAWAPSETMNFFHNPESGMHAFLFGYIRSKHLRSDIAKAFDNPSTFIPRWNGSHILLVVNEKSGEIHLWNSWCGSYPLFYSSNKDRLTVSTSEELLSKTLGGCKLAPDYGGITELLYCGHLVGDRTIHKDIRSIPPDSHVTIGDNRKFTIRRCSRIRFTEDQAGKSMQELVDLKADILFAAIDEVLELSDEFYIPLSGGLDSRLIAARANEKGKKLRALTYDTNRNNLLFAREAARAMGAAWQRVNVGSEYLREATPQWLSLFGASIHAHGMYHWPIIQKFQERGTPVLTGFYGDRICGKQYQQLDMSLTGRISFLASISREWEVSSLQRIVKYDLAEQLEDIAISMKQLVDGMDCPDNLISSLTDLWTRQRKMIFFQTYLYNHWNPSFDPYNNLDLIQFFFSLPDHLRSERTLSKEILKKYYPKLARVPGTFQSDGSPLVSSSSYQWRQRIARRLPNAARIGPFALWKAMQLNPAAQSITHLGKAAFFPLDSMPAGNYDSIFDMNEIHRVVDSALQRPSDAYKVHRIQPILYRYSNPGTE